MILQGQVTNIDDPMTIAVRGMMQQIHMMGTYTENIAHADMPGYQRKVPVVTTFAETLGMKGVDTVTDTSVGRIHSTLRPLDFALNSQGFFQKLQADGKVALTRDGRFRLDKDGVLRSDDLMPILSRQGTPIKLPFIPKDLNHIKVSTDGWIDVLNVDTGTTTRVGQIGVASQQGGLLDNIDIRQKYVEESNVFLHEEFVGMVIPKRNFQANRQMFLTQSNVLSRLIQELGRAQ